MKSMKPSFLCLSLAALGMSAAALHAENAELKRMQTEIQNLYKGKVDKEVESYKKGVAKAKLEFRQDLANQIALVDKVEILLLKALPPEAKGAIPGAPAPAAAPGAAPAAGAKPVPKDDKITYMLEEKKYTFTVEKKKTLEAQDLAEMKGGVVKMLRTDNPTVEPKDAGDLCYGLRLWMKDGMVMETAFRPDCSQFVVSYPISAQPFAVGPEWVPALNAGPLLTYFKRLLPSGK